MRSLARPASFIHGPLLYSHRFLTHKTLVAIHAVDPARVGLADYGRTEGYIGR
jgi:hypothetical protein